MSLKLFMDDWKTSKIINMGPAKCFFYTQYQHIFENSNSILIPMDFGDFVFGKVTSASVVEHVNLALMSDPTKKIV